jgi:hypothetical protein
VSCANGGDRTYKMGLLLTLGLVTDPGFDRLMWKGLLPAADLSVMLLYVLGLRRASCRPSCGTARCASGILCIVYMWIPVVYLKGWTLKWSHDNILAEGVGAHCLE